jgi:hypothetical protein
MGTTQLIPSPALASPALQVPAVFAGPERAERRFWEFFTTQISNDHTRRAYFHAVRCFASWCDLMAIATPINVILKPGSAGSADSGGAADRADLRIHPEPAQTGRHHPHLGTDGGAIVIIDGLLRFWRFIIPYPEPK